MFIYILQLVTVRFLESAHFFFLYMHMVAKAILGKLHSRDEILMSFLEKL